MTAGSTEDIWAYSVGGWAWVIFYHYNADTTPDRLDRQKTATADRPVSSQSASSVVAPVIVFLSSSAAANERRRGFDM
jgi:hypothetical protein